VGAGLLYVVESFFVTIFTPSISDNGYIGLIDSTDVSIGTQTTSLLSTIYIGTSGTDNSSCGNNENNNECKSIEYAVRKRLNISSTNEKKVYD
jgi:hypothetical protein